MITAEHRIDQGAPPSPMSERVFGLFVGAVLTVVSTGPMIFGKPFKPRLFYFAATLAALAVLCPVLLKWPKTIWLFITHKVSLVVNLVLLGVMFYLVVTPVALFFRLLGRDSLKRKLDPQAPSYWVNRSGGEAAQKSMQNQF